MAKAQKTVSIRLEADDYQFLSSLAEAEKEDLSTAVRDLRPWPRLPGSGEISPRKGFAEQRARDSDAPSAAEARTQPCTRSRTEDGRNKSLSMASCSA
jgi:hypothetical protein